MTSSPDQCTLIGEKDELCFRNSFPLTGASHKKFLPLPPKPTQISKTHKASKDPEDTKPQILMKLTTISTLGVVVALAAASLLPGNYGLAEEASVMGAARAKNETGAESTGANTTASFNATAADLLSDVSVFLVVGSVLLETPCLYRGAGGGSGRDRYRCRHTRPKEFPSKRLAKLFRGDFGVWGGFGTAWLPFSIGPQPRTDWQDLATLSSNTCPHAHTHTHSLSLSLCSPD